MTDSSRYTGAIMPDGVFSLLDTDLYKLTMQSAILKFFAKVKGAYAFTNRTPHMRLTRGAFTWLTQQINRLGTLSVAEEELTWLRETCPFLGENYLRFLQAFRLRPEEHVTLSFQPVTHANAQNDDESMPGDVEIAIRGLWLETILYEIPILALVSEAYFKFVDRDWNHDGQVERAREKGRQLMQKGCVFSEFGSRRRRDYRTHASVIQGLVEAQREGEADKWPGKCSGTSNVHFAMRFGLTPIGTVAHEWFMGIAALHDDYARTNELALRYWTAAFGRGVLAIALTDTFGTPDFLRAFARPAQPIKDGVHPSDKGDVQASNEPTFAQIFTGVRQDSGDPLEFLSMMKDFYKQQGITDRKIIVYSDSLNVEKCIAYKQATDEAGLTPSFGVGTFFTNDFTRASSDGAEKSVPLNIVIKLVEAEGRPAVKLSDNRGKNMGEEGLVRKVKEIVRYEEREWKDGDEAHRWDRN